MRGSIQYKDVYDLTPAERNRMINFIAKRLENEFKKSFKTQVY